MARIPGLPKSKAGLLTRFAYWYSKRRFGKVPEPLTVVAHHAWISTGCGAFEFSLQKAQLVDNRLKALASLKAATLVGCPF